ncbi:MAG: DUF2484 family protein [Pseudomonadota bacterium]
MTISAVFVVCCLSVVAATLLAPALMHRQHVASVTLLLVMLALMAWLSGLDGWAIGGLPLLGFLSMFHPPLRYFAKPALALPVELPKKLRERAQ